jgi:hypothetical protein
MNKEPFDPLRGAFILIAGLIGLVALTNLMIFVGCILNIESLCTRQVNTGQVTLELITAIAVLIAARKPPGAT